MDPQFVILIFSLIYLAESFESGCENPPTEKVVCYFGSWAIYRPDKGKFKVSDIEPNYCTHLIYTFAGLSIDGEIAPLDPQIDNGLETGYKAAVQMKTLNPCLKVLISIGGWNEESEKYSMLAEDSERRSKFVDQALRFVVHYGFDGIDFDWEYPTFRGGLPQDRSNFVKLLTELKESLSKRNKLLTIAVAGSISTAQAAYELPKMCSLADQIHIMAYDQHEPSKTSYHSPLYPNLNNSVHFYIDSGCPKSKLILGIPSYGRSFTLQDPDSTELGAPVVGFGAPGKYTASDGFLGFNEICELQKNGDWHDIYDSDSGSHYTFHGNQWVSYDGLDSVIQKVEFVQENELGGVLFWTLDTDDFTGTCYKQKFPLLEIAAYILLGIDIKDEL